MGRTPHVMAGRTSSRRAASGRRRGLAFTLIELMVVLAIVSLLVSIAAPRYFGSIQRARENTLRTSLNVMREAIDKYLGDQGRYPADLGELVTRHYLRNVPTDPITGRTDTWILVPPPEDAIETSGLADVRSGAEGQGSNGTAYGSW
jgi:prepilin-type N-terminal cleavage/methylation domain-containing protein